LRLVDGKGIVKAQGIAVAEAVSAVLPGSPAELDQEVQSGARGVFGVDADTFRPRLPRRLYCLDHLGDDALWLRLPWNLWAIIWSEVGDGQVQVLDAGTRRKAGATSPATARIQPLRRMDGARPSPPTPGLAWR